MQGTASSWYPRFPRAAAARPPDTRLERTQPGRLCLLQGEACDPLILWPAFLPWGWEKAGWSLRQVEWNPWEVVRRKHRPEPSRDLSAYRLKGVGWPIFLCTNFPQKVSASRT